MTGIAGRPVQVRNPEASGLQVESGAYMRSDLPVAGFSIRLVFGDRTQTAAPADLLVQLAALGGGDSLDCRTEALILAGQLALADLLRAREGRAFPSERLTYTDSFELPRWNWTAESAWSATTLWGSSATAFEAMSSACPISPGTSASATKA